MFTGLQYFRYKAISESGEVLRGEYSATGALALSRELSARGLTLVSYRRTWRKLRQRDSAAHQRWARKDLIHFVFHLEQMLVGGISIVEAINEFLHCAEKNSLALVAGELLNQIDAGKSLSAACATLPGIFSPMVVSMLQAGEQSGKLEEILHELGEMLKWQDESVTRFRGVLIYPTFVGLVLFAVVIFIMTWLVPGMVTFIGSAGATLPWHTKALITTSGFITDYWTTAVIFVAAGFALIWVSAAVSIECRITLDRIILRSPLIGPVLLKTRLARFSRCASMMYSAGINIVDVLGYSRGSLNNRLLERSAEEVGKRLADGSSIATGFSEADGFPALVGRLLRVGESTGALDQSFNQISYIYDRESRDLTEKLEQSLGPLMTVSVGLIMMWVVVSVIGPIYDLVFGMSGSF